jgi:hypothetical protein
MTLEAIKEIEQLPPEQQTMLADWLSERDWQAWDERIERDFSPGGPGAPLLVELEREIVEGGTELLISRHGPSHAAPRFYCRVPRAATPSAPRRPPKE